MRKTDLLWNQHNEIGSLLNISIDLTKENKKESKSINNKNRKCVIKKYIKL